jgi:hypothetical protein
MGSAEIEAMYAALFTVLSLFQIKLHRHSNADTDGFPFYPRRAKVGKPKDARSLLFQQTIWTFYHAQAI